MTDLAAWPLTGILAWVIRAMFFYLVWRIIKMLKRILANNAAAFARIEELEEARLTAEIAVQQATERLEIRQDELDERMMKRQAHIAADLAASLTTQRQVIAHSLDADRAATLEARHDILAAVAEVHQAATASFHEANDINRKILGVNQSLQNLNERLVNEEPKPDADPPTIYHD